MKAGGKVILLTPRFVNTSIIWRLSTCCYAAGLSAKYVDAPHGALSAAIKQDLMCITQPSVREGALFFTSCYR